MTLVLLAATGPLQAAPDHSPDAGTPAVNSLDAAIDAVAPDVRKWASVVVVRETNGTPAFQWAHYRDQPDARDFWPASTIKLYTAVAALEYLHELGFPLDTILIFEHQGTNGHWVLDTARSMREMLSEVFRRSSNEDYTLLLRFVGLDRINTQFLVPAKGFEGSALMRGYVSADTRPWGYNREAPQRITLQTADGRSTRFTHTWSGRPYSEERGCTVIDAKTGNVTTPRDLAECLRRVFFDEHLAETDRYAVSPEMLHFLRQGGGGYRGLEAADTGAEPSGWTRAIGAVFPTARYFHKAGLISNYALDAAYVDDSAGSGKRFIFVAAVNAGSASQPDHGETLVSQMAGRIAQWVARQP